MSKRENSLRAVRKYRRAHPERVRASKHKHYVANKEKVAEYNRAYFAANAEKTREARHKWNTTHLEEKRVLNQKRRALRKGNGGSYTVSEWLALREQYKNACIGPGPHGGSLTQDHVIPLLLGGTSNISNIQPFCKRCNSRKGTKTIDYRQGATV